MTDQRTIPMPVDLDRTQPLGPYAGWYGKMPCLGDFASRRLLPEFKEPWDRWLQLSIAASKRALGESWLDLFLTSPMWRFVLAPGLCGDYAWAGLLVPSVDKVGRYFPLTIALPLERGEADFQDVFAAHAWFTQLEKIGLSALNVEFSIDALDMKLAFAPFPVSALPRSAAAAAREVAGWLGGPAESPCAIGVEGDAPFSTVTERAARALFSTAAAGKTFWWTADENGAATAFHCCAGLPPADYYAVLLGATPVLEHATVSDALSADPLKAFGFEASTDDTQPAG